VILPLSDFPALDASLNAASAAAVVLFEVARRRPL